MWAEAETRSWRWPSISDARQGIDLADALPNIDIVGGMAHPAEIPEPVRAIHLVAELVKRNDFEVPEALVERQIDIRLERGLRALAAQGMRPEDLKKMDLNRLRVGQREQAVQEVKASLLLEKIAEEEKIEVSDAEIDREIEALARQSKQTPEAIRARLTRDGALDRIRSRIRSEKTLDFLYQQSA